MSFPARFQRVYSDKAMSFFLGMEESQVLFHHLANGQMIGALFLALTALDAVLRLGHDLGPPLGEETFGRQTFHHTSQDHHHLDGYTLRAGLAVAAAAAEARPQLAP